ncbi:MAG TPA: glycosyltransferase, partial [Ornithinibacter sp.]|nr:glycosyltransferase [Ornithinibacter sp.]
MTDGAGRRRVVIISPELPHDHVPHAGGRYVGTLVDVLEARAHVVVLVPDVPVNREAEAAAGAPSHHVVTGRRTTRPAWLRGLFRALTLADRVRLRRDPASLPWVVAAGLVTTRPAVQALRSADVVDLQWSHLVRLEPLVRLLNRRARVIGTFHDVRSQRFRRAAAREGDPALRRPLARAARSEARVQARLVDRLDVSITFSDKDARELGDSPTSRRVTVVPPPLAHLHAPTRRRDPHPTAVFVGHLARPENDEAVTWLLDEVWPLVRQAVPDARLRVVGGGAAPTLVRRLAREPGVTGTG